MSGITIGTGITADGVQYAKDANGNVTGLVGPNGPKIPITGPRKKINAEPRQLIPSGIITSVTTGAVSAITGTTKFYQAQSGSSIASNIPITQTRGGYASVTNNPAASKTPGSLQYSTIHYGTQIEFRFNNQGGTTYYLIRVNGQYYSLTPTALDSTHQILTIVFATAARRRIDIIGAQIVTLATVWVNANDGLEAAPVRGPRMIVLGDSMDIGNNGTITTPNGYAYLLGDYLGCDDIWSCGLGGTGYATRVGGFNNNFLDRLQSDVISNSPDIVLVSGGGLINDSGSATSLTNAQTLYANLRSGLPNAQIFGAMLFNNPVASMAYTSLNYKDSLKAIVQGNGATWLDLLEMPMQSIATPYSSTLLNSVSAGATLFYTADGLFMPHDVLEIGSGTTRERVDVTGNGGDKSSTISGVFQYAHAAGETVKQVGRSLWSGAQGSATYGTCNSYVAGDGTHPTDIGHDAIAWNLANQMYPYINL